MTTSPALASPMAPPETKPRLMMIDVAKGLGILLIVLGHNILFSRAFDGFADLLSAFRLPFFFFISGTMFSVGKRSVGRVAFERADAWLKPVLVVVLVVAAARLLAGRTTMEATALELLYATGFTMNWTAMWSLPHLWLLYVATTWLMTDAKPMSDQPWKRAALVTSLLLSGHFLLKQFKEGPACERVTEFSIHIWQCGLPFSADLLLITAGFFLLGHFLSARTKQFAVNRWLLAIALVVMSACQWFFDADVDFNHRRYDDLLICTLQAFSGIYLMLCLCKGLTYLPRVPQLLAYCGRGSLFILIFHAPILVKIIEKMPAFVPSPIVVGVTAFIVPLAASLLLWNIVKRSHYLSLLMLPVKRTSTPRVSPLTSVSPT